LNETQTFLERKEEEKSKSEEVELKMLKG